MAARILDGKQIAAEIRNEVSAQIAAYTVQHGPIRLAAILVGESLMASPDVGAAVDELLGT